MGKYKIILYYKNGRTESIIGVGKPEGNGLEIHVRSPDGKEIIRHREALQGFTVTEYKEEEDKNKKVVLL